MMLKNKKGYTLLELIIVIAMMSIIGTIASNYHTGWLKNSVNTKRENIVRVYGLLSYDIIKSYGDIPKGYCTADGINYTDYGCFDVDGCLNMTCDVNNGFCSNGGNGPYFDFRKMINDYNYDINPSFLIEGEHFPDGFNYRICKKGATSQAYSDINIIKETGINVPEETYTNPSFIFRKLDTDTGINKEIYKYINYF